MGRVWARIGSLALAISLVGAAGCSSNVANPVPVLFSISPQSRLAGSAGFTLLVTGNNFVSGASAVLWNGVAKITTVLGSTQIQAIINPSDIQLPGSASVTVLTAGPGGGSSNPLTFTITPQQSPIPAITSLSPQATTAGGSSFFLTVNGNNFVSTSVVFFNGGSRNTTFLGATQLVATINNTDILLGGTAQVQVLNPPPGGGGSNLMPFSITNPIPIIASLVPTNTPAGATANLTLTVNGSGFLCAKFSDATDTTCSTSASVVNWNGSPRTTTFVAGAQLTATINTTDLAAAEVAQVTVTNPAPGGGSSAPGAVAVLPGSTGTGLPELADVSTTGAQASNGIGNLSSSGPVTAGNGRFLAYASVSNNLFNGLTNGVANVFLFDSCLGVTSGCVPQTTVASLAGNTQQANSPSLEPSLSADGRFIAFSSAATTLVPSTPPGTPQQIYVRDACTGVVASTTTCTPTTTLVSVAPDGTSFGNGASSHPFVSSDGEFVVFASTATNLVQPNLPAGTPQQIYLRDTCNNNTSGNCKPATTLVSVASGGVNPANGASSQPVLSTGGRFVAFASSATNLISPALPAGAPQQIFWRDTCTGASGCVPATRLITVPADGTAAANQPSLQPAMSLDGRFVGFASKATNLLAGVSSAFQQIFLRDTCTGVSGCAATTTLVSIGTDGTSPAGADASSPSLSGSGEFVAFASAANNLTSGGTNGFAQIFVRDTCAGNSSCTARTALASVAADKMMQGTGNSLAPAISGDGHFVAFISFANNLVANDTSALEDIFLAVTTF